MTIPKARKTIVRFICLYGHHVISFVGWVERSEAHTDFGANGKTCPRASARWQSLMERQALGDDVKGLAIDRVDRHLRTAE